MIEFQRRSGERAAFEERRAVNVVESICTLGRSKDYELLVVGRRWPSSRVGAFDLGNWWGENTKLGPVGNILASQGLGIVSSVLVVQQHCAVKLCNMMPLTAMNGSTSDTTISPNISTAV